MMASEQAETCRNSLIKQLCLTDLTLYYLLYTQRGCLNLTIYRTDVIHIRRYNKLKLRFKHIPKFEYCKTQAVFIPKYKNEATAHYKWTNSRFIEQCGYIYAESLRRFTAKRKHRNLQKLHKHNYSLMFIGPCIIAIVDE